MSEDVKGLIGTQEEMMRRLKAIGADLWRGAAGDEKKPAQTEEPEAMISDIEEAWRQEMGKGAAAAQPKKAESTPAAQPVRAPRPKASIENLWMTADETVDWTEALLRGTPRDGLTEQKLWSFYHRMARRVLEGDIDAYAEVLTTVNPLGDLTRFVSGMVLRTPSPDRLECVFECQPEDLEKYGRDYLGALSLRIVRDLLAILPVTEVAVSGNLNGSEKVSTVLRRDQMLKQKMAFLKPADFIEACGGKMTL